MKKVLAGLMIAMVTGWACGAGTEFFETDTPEAYQHGKFQETHASAEGILSLSLGSKELMSDKEAMFWCLATGANDAVYAGTSEGKIIRVRPAPTATLAELPKVAVFSLLWQDGVLYAGTGPGGVVYRIKEGAKAEKWCETKEDYVWALAPDGQGNILAGTGPNGKLLKIDATGKAALVADTNEPHVLALAVGAKGTIYASTDGKGLVYRIGADGKATVAYDAAESEIRCMTTDGKGNIYFATADVQSGRHGGGPARATSMGGGAGAVSPGRAAGGGGGVAVARPRIRTGMGGGGEGAVSAENAIYRMDSEGMVTKLASVENLMVLSLVWRPDGLYFGTGNSGKLGLVEKDGEVTWVKEEMGSQVLALANSTTGELLVGTGGEGKVLAMGPGCATEGTYTSQVFDGGFVSKFGVISWRGKTPTDTGIEVTTRSGNVETVDDSWSEFSKPYADGAGSEITNPPARYIQYKVRMTSKGGKAGPEVEEVRIAYVAANQPPKVTELSVDGEEKGEPSGKGKQQKGEETETGKHNISWKAEDPNGDKLEFTVSFRGSDEDKWMMLKEKAEGNRLAWDTSAVPDGYYRAKVEASDAPSNTEKRAMTGERVSKPVLVDNTPPVLAALDLKQTGKGAVAVKTTATDATSIIASAAYSVDSGDWKQVDPTDGVLDQKTEAFDFEATGLAAGTHTVTVRVTDKAGNVAAARGTVEVK